MQDESQVSSAVKESSDTSDDLSDAALESESGGVSLPNGIPASSVDRNNDVSSVIFVSWIFVFGCEMETVTCTEQCDERLLIITV